MGLVGNRNWKRRGLEKGDLAVDQAQHRRQAVMVALQLLVPIGERRSGQSRAYAKSVDMTGVGSALTLTRVTRLRRDEKSR